MKKSVPVLLLCSVGWRFWEYKFFFKAVVFFSKGVPEIIEKCGLVRRMYRSIMIGHSNCTTVCYPNKFKEHFLKNSKVNKRCKRRQLLSNDQQESIKVLRKYVRSMDTKKLCKRNVVAKELALRGLNEIVCIDKE